MDVDSPQPFAEHRNVTGNQVAPGVKASIAERRAAKCGFNAPRINTARFRTSTATPLASPAAIRSPYLTIPPGISPAALLDSPVMLPNSQLSPTTGTFPFSFANHESSMLNYMTSVDGSRNNNVDSCFKLKPEECPNSMSGFSRLENQTVTVDNEATVSAEPCLEFEFPVNFPGGSTPKACAWDPATSLKVNADCSCLPMCQSDVAREPVHREIVKTDHTLGGEQKETYSATITVRTTEDEYNWKKYGQKQVKGSEYPRSYYKCTHPNCQVKKKIEHSYDGQITKIIYTGAHDHPKPQQNRRASLGCTSTFEEMPGMVEGNGTPVKVEGGPVWRNVQSRSNDVRPASDWTDGNEGTSSASVVTELPDLFSTSQGITSASTFQSAGTPELSSTLASHDDVDDDGATKGSISMGVDTDDDESESKRRKTENCIVETNLVSRGLREPRVVVQIKSEIDILDDGFRWKKYGQKIVKGNPNPRSYYKCTSPGCSVRKHVERASHDLKFVLTTYVGKHNHEVPAARNSSHVNTTEGNLPPLAASSQPALALSRNNNASECKMNVQDFTPLFHRNPQFSNDYLGSFSNEMKFGASSIYPINLSSLQNMAPFDSLGLNTNRDVMHQSGPVPDFRTALPRNLPASANLSLAGFGFNNSGNLVDPVQSFLSQQQLMESDARSVRPKQEQKDNNVCNGGMPISHQANASSWSSTSYDQVMRNRSS